MKVQVKQNQEIDKQKIPAASNLSGRVVIQNQDTVSHIRNLIKENTYYIQLSNRCVQACSALKVVFGILIYLGVQLFILVPVFLLWYLKISLKGGMMPEELLTALGLYNGTGTK